MTNKEIDKEMAKIMGWVICHTAETWTDKSEAWWCDGERYKKGETHIGGPSGMGICREGYFCPTESISDAFQVVDALIDRNFIKHNFYLKRLMSPAWRCCIGQVEADAETRCLAICLAAKRLIEGEK